MVSPSKATDIDGLYAMQVSTPFIEGAKMGYKANKVNVDSLAKKSTCRIDRGRIIVIEDILIKPGSVMVKNLKKIDENRYKGIRIVPTSESAMYETNTVLYRTENNGLIEEVEVPKDKRFWEKPLASSMRYYLLESSRLRNIEPTQTLPLPHKNITEKVQAPVPPKENYGYIKTFEGSPLNLRMMPAKGSKSIQLIPNGERITIIPDKIEKGIVDGEQGFWYLIDYKGQIGWAWSKYIQLPAQN